MSSTHISSITSHIHKVPSDILAEIFMDLCSETVHIGSDFSLIWILHDVCVRWRHILRSIPRLWKKFEVDLSGTEIKIVAQRVQTCLEFSQNSPLSIDLHSLADPDDTVPSQLYKNIARHADRWISISIDTNLLSRLMEQTVLEDIVNQRGLLQLRKLTITDSRFYGPTITNSSFVNFDVFKSATALEEVNFIGVRLVTGSSRHRLFPWVNVKKITFSSCWLSADQIISVLSRTTSLEVLKCTDTCVRISGLPSIPTTIVLPSLHTLFITNSALYSFPNTCRFSVPSLRDFHLDDFHSDDIEGCPFWTSVTQANIKRLHLGSSVDGIAFEYLTSLHTVEELSLLYFDQYWDGFLPSLIWNTGSYSETTNALPALRKLDICDFFYDDDSFAQHLSSIMHSRSGSSDTTRNRLVSISCTIKSLYDSGDDYDRDDYLSAPLITLRSLKALATELGIIFKIFVDENGEKLELS